MFITTVVVVVIVVVVVVIAAVFLSRNHMLICLVRARKSITKAS